MILAHRPVHVFKFSFLIGLSHLLGTFLQDTMNSFFRCFPSSGTFKRLWQISSLTPLPVLMLYRTSEILSVWRNDVFVTNQSSHFLNSTEVWSPDALYNHPPQTCRVNMVKVMPVNGDPTSTFIACSNQCIKSKAHLLESSFILRIANAHCCGGYHQCLTNPIGIWLAGESTCSVMWKRKGQLSVSMWKWKAQSHWCVLVRSHIDTLNVHHPKPSRWSVSPRECSICIYSCVISCIYWKDFLK